MKSNRKGFTLVELLVAISILGIIMMLAIPQMLWLRDNNKNSKYEKYAESVLTSGKLYTDSYGKDMFGHNSSGCYDIPYMSLEGKNLAKDINIDDLTCNTYAADGVTAATFVRVYKSQDIYLYDIAIKCVDKSGKVIYEKGLDGDICNGTTMDTEGPVIEFSGISSDWTTGRDASGNPLIATVYLRDSYGLKENTSVEYAWTKDTSNIGALSYTTKSFDNTRSDAISELSFDVTYPQNENGIWYLVVRPGANGLRDLNGNYFHGNHMISSEVKLDNTKPIIEGISNSSDGVWSKEPVSVSGKIKDAHSGVKKIYYSFDSSGSSPVAFGTSSITSGSTGPFNVSMVWDSTLNKSVYLIGEDMVGNKTSVQSAGKVMVDTTKPTCSISLTGTTGDNGWYKGSAVTVGLTKNDSDSQLSQYGLSNSSTVVYNSTGSATQGDTASVTWYGFVKDNAGNTNSCSKTFKVDTGKPTCSVSITSGTANSSGNYTTSVTTSLTRNDSLSTIQSYGMATSSSATYNSKATLSSSDNGTYTHYGFVKDMAGNVNSCSKKFTISKYSCSSGTLTYDDSKGYICVKSATKNSGITGYTNISCGGSCSGCNEGICGPPNDGCWGGTTGKAYCSCPKFGTSYDCPSGWSTYSGSGSSKKCYKKASS